MANAKTKLFDTVLRIHSHGSGVLTASEQSIIESETKALLNAASGKFAMKVPEGFDQLISDLKGSDNPEEAYQMVVSFMKSNGDISEDKPDSLKDKSDGPELEKIDRGDSDDSPQGFGDGIPKGDGPKGDGIPKGDGPKGDGPKGDGPKGDGPKGDGPKGDGPKGDGPKGDGPKGDGSKGDGSKGDGPKGDGPKGDGPKGDGPKGDIEFEKSEVLDKANKLDKGSMKETEEDLKSLKEEKESKPSQKDGVPTTKDMGFKDVTKASRYRVRLTSERNILATFDSKPLFIYEVPANVKSSSLKLKTAANKVLAWLVYEGEEEAARKCGARLIQSGVDDDVTLVVDAPCPSDDKSPIDDSEDVLKDTLESPASDSREGYDTDTQDSHSKVEAGVDDGVELVVSDGGDSASDSILSDSDNEIVEDPGMPNSDTQEEADMDFTTVEASYRSLYANRTKKAVKVATEAFVEKFIRAMRVASNRMLLNHDEHPFKAAAYDVLTDDGIVDGLDEDDAADVTEMIASVGHKAFVDKLLASTHDLMQKSDEYIKDAESDLETQNAKPVKINSSRVASFRSSKSKKLSKAASNGNFALKNLGMPVTHSKNKPVDGGIRSVVSDTQLGRRLSSLNRLKGQR